MFRDSATVFIKFDIPRGVGAVHPQEEFCESGFLCLAFSLCVSLKCECESIEWRYASIPRRGTDRDSAELEPSLTEVLVFFF